MKLLNYNNKYVKLIDVDNNKFIGMAYYMDAETNESEEDILDIKTKDGMYYGFYESDIKSIEILE
ncbi:hypothetical protein ABGF49_07385 [Helcococcus ovis]|uniref:hypothetical protein n=1 Tax=Helcococcus TaxID=31983 RepID=UPI0038BC3D50